MPYTGGFPRVSELKSIRGRYDFSIDAGAISDIVISAEKIPAGAYITHGFVQVDTAVTGASAAVAVNVESAGDIVASAAISGAPWSTTGFKSIIPVGTGATVVKTTVARNIVATIATAVTTAGVFDVVLFYVVFSD